MMGVLSHRDSYAIPGGVLSINARVRHLAFVVDAGCDQWEKPMTNRMHTVIAAALAAASVASATNVASAAPAAAFAIANAAPSDVEAVRGGWGWGVGAGFLGGAIVGSALAARPYYYAYPPGYYGAPYYPAPVYGAPPGYAAPNGDAVAYCARKYRSYDPASGTFLGNDGARHPCP
jgi:hypothetical protein